MDFNKIYLGLSFIIGSIVGSFLNVCIYRIPREESIIFPSSHCTSCKHPLSVIDLIPILSYFINKGHCRYCGKAFSFRYPAVELITALFFLYLFYKYHFSLITLFYLSFICLLIIVFFIDLDFQIIPNVITFPGIILGLISSLILGGKEGFIISIIGGFLGFFLLLSVELFSQLFFKKTGMGGGDLKLAAMMGTFLGWKDLLIALLISFTLGGIVGILLIILKLKSRQDYVPFGPALVLGSILTLFLGREIIHWYWSLFLLR